MNTAVLFSLEDIIGRKNKKVIIAGTSAADYWGFSNKLNGEIQLMTDKNYNPNFKSKKIRIFRRKIEKFKEEITFVEWENKKFKITKKEATFIEVFKSFKGNYNDQNIEICLNFFESNYNKKFLFHLAEKHNVLHSIKLLEALWWQKINIKNT